MEVIDMVNQLESDDKVGMLWLNIKDNDELDE